MEPAAPLLTLRKNWRSESVKYQRVALFTFFTLDIAVKMKPFSHHPASLIHFVLRFMFVRYRKMNKRLAARLPGSVVLMPDDLPLDVAVTRKPSSLTNGSGAPSLPQLIARGTDTVPYELLRKPMKMDGGSPNAPGSPPDV